MTVAAREELLNYIGGQWERPDTSDTMDVHNPATAEVIATAPQSTKNEVDKAVAAASEQAPHLARIVARLGNPANKRRLEPV